MTAISEGIAQLDEDDGEGWVDRYRPRCLEDMALDPDNRQLIEMYIDSRRSQSLILHGPPGTGKTTLADIIVERLVPRGNVLRVNASAQTGIDIIRDRVIPWMKVYHFAGVVGGVRTSSAAAILSEADGLSAEAQGALKDPMESFGAQCMIIFTTNAVDDLDAAMRSRCRVIEMEPPPLKERARVLERVLAAEGHEIDGDLVLQFADRYTDMRELLRAAEDSIGMHNTLVIEPVKGDPEYWPHPVDGSLLLSGLAEAFSRYLALPAEVPAVLALWTLFAHAHEAFGYSPILTAVSPVKRAGKTRLLEVLRQLVPNPVLTASLTPASIFRLGGETRPRST